MADGQQRNKRRRWHGCLLAAMLLTLLLGLSSPARAADPDQVQVGEQVYSGTIEAATEGMIRLRMEGGSVRGFARPAATILVWQGVTDAKARLAAAGGLLAAAGTLNDQGLYLDALDRCTKAGATLLVVRQEAPQEYRQAQEMLATIRAQSVLATALMRADNLRQRIDAALADADPILAQARFEQFIEQTAALPNHPKCLEIRTQTLALGPDIGVLVDRRRATNDIVQRSPAELDEAELTATLALVERTLAAWDAAPLRDARLQLYERKGREPLLKFRQEAQERQARLQTGSAWTNQAEATLAATKPLLAQGDYAAVLGRLDALAKAPPENDLPVQLQDRVANLAAQLATRKRETERRARMREQQEALQPQVEGFVKAVAELRQVAEQGGDAEVAAAALKTAEALGSKLNLGIPPELPEMQATMRQLRLQLPSLQQALTTRVRDLRLAAGWFIQPQTRELVAPATASFQEAFASAARDGHDEQMTALLAQWQRWRGDDPALAAAWEQRDLLRLAEARRQLAAGDEGGENLLAELARQGHGRVRQEAANRLGERAQRRQFWHTTGSVLVAALILLLLLGTGAAVYAVRPGQRIARLRRRFERAEKTWRSQPAQCRKSLQSLLETTQRLAPRAGAEGRELLGHLYYRLAFLALLLEHDSRTFDELLQQAADHLPLSRQEILNTEVEILAETNQTDARALERYLRYLSRPRAEVNAVVATRLLALLEQAGRISPEGQPEADPELARRAEVARYASAIPWQVPGVSVIDGPSLGAQAAVRERCRIGRASDNELVLEDGSVSRLHAEIVVEPGGARLHDREARWGVFLAATRIVGSVPLADGDQFRCGMSTCQYQAQPRFLEHGLAWAHFTQGVALYSQGEWQRALGQFGRALALDAKSLDSPVFIARIWQGQGDLERAEEGFRQVLQLAPEHAQAHLQLGCLLAARLEVGEDDSELANEALTHLQTATRLAPDDAEAHYQLALRLRASHRPEDALWASERAAQLASGEPRYQLLLARCNLALGKRDAAQAALRHGLTLSPLLLECLVLSGDLAAEDEDWTRAAAHYERVLQIESEQEAKLFTRDPVFLYRVAQAHFRNQQYLRAVSVLAATPATTTESLVLGARCHARIGNFEAAARILGDMLASPGAPPVVRYYLASVQARQGQHVTALATATPLLQTPHWERKGAALTLRLYLQQGDLAAATALLAQYEQRFPGDPLLALERGRLALLRDDKPAARVALEAFLQIHPENVEVRGWLGWVHFELGEDEQARPFLERVAGDSHEEEESRGRAWYCLGRIAARQGNPAKAEELFSKARRAGFQAAELSFHLALAYAANQRYQEAYREFSSPALRDIEHPQLRRNRAICAWRVGEELVRTHKLENAAQFLAEAHQLLAALGAAEAANVAALLAELYFRQALADFPAAVSGSTRARLREALALRDWPQCRYALGVACYLCRDFAAAQAEFTRLRTLGFAPAQVVRALALTAEKSDRTSDAEGLWGELAAMPGEAGLAGKLGQAGLFARQRRWAEAAAALAALLPALAASKSPDLESLAVLAATYFQQAGQGQAALAVLQQHLAGQKGIAARMHGALLAQQDRLEEALTLLREACGSGPDAEGDRLCARVSIVLASRLVLQGKLEEAARLLRETRSAVPRLGPALEGLLASIETARQLGDLRGAAGAKALAAIEAAYERNPRDPRLQRNLAVLMHREAIREEETGAHAAAKKHWESALVLWLEISDAANAFWQAYLPVYNQGRHPREQLAAGEVPVVCRRIGERLLQVHQSFLQVYAAAGELEHCRRHLALVRQTFAPPQRQPVWKEMLGWLQRTPPSNPLVAARFALMLAEECSDLEKEQKELLITGLAFDALGDLLYELRFDDALELARLLEPHQRVLPEQLRNFPARLPRVNRELLRQSTQLAKLLLGAAEQVPEKLRKMTLFFFVIKLANSDLPAHIPAEQLGQIVARELPEILKAILQSQAK